MVCRVAIGRQLVTDDRVTAERLHSLVLQDARGIPTQDSPANAAHLGGRRRPSARHLDHSARPWVDGERAGPDGAVLGVGDRRPHGRDGVGRAPHERDGRVVAFNQDGAVARARSWFLRSHFVGLGVCTTLEVVEVWLAGGEVIRPEEPSGDIEA